MEKNIANLEIKTIPLTQLQGWDKNHLKCFGKKQFTIQKYDYLA